MNKTSNKVTIIIDESGTLPDPDDAVIVVAAVGAFDLGKLKDIKKDVRKIIQNRKQKTNSITELKFYTAGERTKRLYLKELVSKKVAFFVLIVEKHGQSISDSPENMAVLAYILLKECLLFYEDNIKEFVFDRHFHKVTDRKRFDRLITDLLKIEVNIKHLDSIENTEINTADMVAGSVLWKYTGRDDKFYKVIKSRIIVEKMVNWKEAKRIFVDKIKKLT